MKLSRIRKRLSSLRSRYGISIVVLVLLVAVLNVVQFALMDNVFTHTTKIDMMKAADEIEQLDFLSDSFMREISDCESTYNIYVEIYYPRDALIYTSETNNAVFEPSSSSDKSESKLRPRIMTMLEHKDVDQFSYFEIRREYFASAEYIVYGRSSPEAASSIMIYFPVDVINANARTASWTIFSVSVILLLIVVALTRIYTYTFVLPIDKINGVTKKMTQMKFDELCPPFKIRELDELSTSVNALSSSLDMTLRDLHGKNKRLEQDIERERTLEEARKLFITNASHELKTPIAIIQGYAEGLKFGITDDSPEEYCDIIIEEAQKMNSLVMRLLEMTRYDYAGHRLNCSPLPIADTLKRFSASREKILLEKGITLTIDIDPSFIGYGDSITVETVYGNYLSNAISHAEFEKEIRVTCAAVDDNNYRISVFNTGRQIADEDIEKIWQSFYRADKARSRAEGRFGLGLSIVAAAQELSGCGYGVKNCENGVEFWFDIARYTVNVMSLS